MTGQLSIFDLPKQKKRPCDYGFQRYIGQRVYTRKQGIRTIEGIAPYYTYLSGDLIGTPYDIWPVEGKTNDYI